MIWHIKNISIIDHSAENNSLTMRCHWINLFAASFGTTRRGNQDVLSPLVSGPSISQIRETNDNLEVLKTRTRSKASPTTTTQLNLESTARKRWQYTHSKDVDTNLPRRPYGRFITSIFRVLLAYYTKFIMTVMNKTYLHDENNNLRYLFDREDDVGVITISNHQTVADDPGIWVGTIPLKKLTLDTMRTIVMAEEWYYSFGKFSANIYRGLNCLPIKRGDPRGLQSPALKEMHARLNGIVTSKGKTEKKKKEWAHLMIEGRLYQSWRFQKDKPKLGKFRRGTAKLIASSPPKKTIVLPVYHTGMDEIFPEEKPEGWDPEKNHLLAGKTKSYFPRKGKRVDVYVGDPIDFSDLLPENGYDFNEVTDEALLETINGRLFEGMVHLDALARESY